MYSDLPQIMQEIRTLEDSMTLKSEIEELEQAVYRTGTNNFEEIMDKQVRAQISTILSKTLGKGAPGASVEKRMEVLRELTRELEDLKLLHLTLAKEMSRNWLLKISDWIRQEVDTKTILEVEINQGILGGAVIEYRGKWGDFSLKKDLDEYWKEKI